jgi:hypothetical protein
MLALALVVFYGYNRLANGFGYVRCGQLTDGNPIIIPAISDFSIRLLSLTRVHNEERINIVINASEEIRLRYLYRRLILGGKIALSLESAKKVIGPDCAYHLYSVQSLKKMKKRRFSW